jgi:effector-binding domain-containing protein
MSEHVITAVQLDPLRVAIIRDNIENYFVIGHFFKELHAELGKNGITPAGPQLAIYFDPDYTPQNPDVAVAVPVDAGATLPEGGRARIDDLPGGWMVSLLRTGPWDDFRPDYEAIMEWVQANGYRITGPNREIWRLGPGSGAAPEAYQMEIQFPIEKN